MQPHQNGRRYLTFVHIIMITTWTDGRSALLIPHICSVTWSTGQQCEVCCYLHGVQQQLRSCMNCGFCDPLSLLFFSGLWLVFTSLFFLFLWLPLYLHFTTIHSWTTRRTVQDVLYRYYMMLMLMMTSRTKQQVIPPVLCVLVQLWNKTCQLYTETFSSISKEVLQLWNYSIKIGIITTIIIMMIMEKQNKYQTQLYSSEILCSKNIKV